MKESWENVVGILYQDILGSHEEKVKIITRWMTVIVQTPILPINIDIMVRTCCDKYNKD